MSTRTYNLRTRTGTGVFQSDRALEESLSLIDIDRLDEVAPQAGNLAPKARATVEVWTYRDVVALRPHREGRGLLSPVPFGGPTRDPDRMKVPDHEVIINLPLLSSSVILRRVPWLLQDLFFILFCSSSNLLDGCETLIALSPGYFTGSPTILSVTQNYLKVRAEFKVGHPAWQAWRGLMWHFVIADGGTRSRSP